MMLTQYRPALIFFSQCGHQIMERNDRCGIIVECLVLLFFRRKSCLKGADVGETFRFALHTPGFFNPWINHDDPPKAEITSPRERIIPTGRRSKSLGQLISSFMQIEIVCQY